MEKRVRDTPEIVIPKGESIEDFLDCNAEDYFGEEEPFLKAEVNVKYE